MFDATSIATDAFSDSVTTRPYHRQLAKAHTARSDKKSPPYSVKRDDVERARSVQHSLVPSDQTDGGLELAVTFQPLCGVGGDYVDAIPLADNRYLIVIADVCGKGIHAALVATALHGQMRALVDAGFGLTQIVRRVNAYLCKSFGEDGFVTMACVVLDTVTGETEAIRAGHFSPAVIDRHGNTRRLHCGSTIPLGIGPLEVDSQRDRLGLGEVLAMYTDGLTESFAETGEMLGVEGLLSCLKYVGRAPVGSSLTELAQHAQRSLEYFRGGSPAEDDCTLILARRNEIGIAPNDTVRGLD